MTISATRLQTNNPYGADEHHNAHLKCAKNETVMVKCDRFDTEYRYDFFYLSVPQPDAIGVHYIAAQPGPKPGTQVISSSQGISDAPVTVLSKLY